VEYKDDENFRKFIDDFSGTAEVKKMYASLLVDRAQTFVEV